MKLPLAPPLAKPCGHIRHVGTCPACQRAALEHQHALLVQASQQ